MTHCVVLELKYCLGASDEFVSPFVSLLPAVLCCAVPSQDWKLVLTIPCRPFATTTDTDGTLLMDVHRSDHSSLPLPVVRPLAASKCKLVSLLQVLASDRYCWEMNSAHPGPPLEEVPDFQEQLPSWKIAPNACIDCVPPKP